MAQRGAADCVGRDSADAGDMGEVTATAAKMRASKMAAAEVPVTATATAEMHVAAAMATPTAVAATTMTTASRYSKTACRQRGGDDERHKSRMEFRHRSLPPATHDITDQPQTTLW